MIDDSLGLAADLDQQMSSHMATYECEWKAALASPERLGRFVTFANTPASDSTLVFVRERDHRVPAQPMFDGVALNSARPDEALGATVGSPIRAKSKSSS